MESERRFDFYPNVQYNSKRRTKFFALFAVLVFFMLLMDGWFIAIKMWPALAINAVIVLFITLIPSTLRENPVNPTKPVLSVTAGSVKTYKKQCARGDVLKVHAIVYLGSVGNIAENRQFMEKVADERPSTGMTGMLEITFKGAGKNDTMYAVIENVVEALTLFIVEGKAEYSLGYSLGKDYRKSTYNLKLLAVRDEGENHASKVKQLI